MESLLACCLGLTVEKSSPTVRLVHYSLKEYLSHNSNLFFKPHSIIAEVCSTYLNFRHIRDLSPALRSIPPTAPFVKYASCYYWGTHARRGNTESVKTLALKLLYGYDNYRSTKVLLLRGMPFWYQPFDSEGTPRGFTGLHGPSMPSYFECVEITVALLETNKGGVRAIDFNGNTAIAWAARRGHEGVVRMLLERNDVNPDKADKWTRTPLARAAKNGNEGVVRMLLKENDVSPDTADKWSRRPLSWAL